MLIAARTTFEHERLAKPHKLEQAGAALEIVEYVGHVRLNRQKIKDFMKKYGFNRNETMIMLSGGKCKTADFNNKKMFWL